MNKREYFIKALKAGAYRYKDWVMGCFSVTGASNNTKQYPYELVRSAAGVHYRNPDDLTELLKISDSSDKEALFRFNDPITLEPEEALNLSETIKTTYGNVFFNYYVLIHAFGNKIPFMAGRVMPKDVEKIIEPILANEPPAGTERDPKLIYIDEYKRFNKSMFGLMGFAQLCVPSATARTMTTDPRIPELRAKLLNKYKDTLHESATVVKIEQELIAMDKEWMKNDPDGGDGFYIYGKSYDVVRKKLFLMHGIETAFKDGADIDLVTNNLNEGWDIDKLPTMVNSLREGAYNRGRDTALGGEAVKFLGRVFQNTTIVEEDCGSNLGWSKSITEDNYMGFIGFFKIVPKGSEELTEASLKASVGKSLTIRTPMMCKTPRTGFCVACMGRRNAINPTALGLLAADVGSQMMGIFMAMMHGRSMKVARYSFKDSIT